MEENPIAPGVRHFIANHIKSVEQLEILCLLASEPSRSWSVGDVYRRILSTEKSVADGLEHFVSHELCTVDAGRNFRFAPKTPELNAAALGLIKAYRERRVAVIEMLYKKAEPAQHFAEAFRLRKKP